MLRAIKQNPEERRVFSSPPSSFIYFTLVAIWATVATTVANPTHAKVFFMSDILTHLLVVF